MRIVIIGGTGHVGGFLTPGLVEDGHEVTVVSRGQRPAPPGGAWESVRHVEATYGDDEFADLIRDLRPDALVDMLGVDVPGLYAALRQWGGHLVACGSVWMYGVPRVVPTPEQAQGPCESKGYARRYAELQQVQEQARRDGALFTAIMPPNICGPGKIPLEGMGGRSIEVHRAHARGEELPLPAPGSTLIGPCDAEDVAQGFRLAIANPDAAAGEILNVGSAYALTAEQFVRTYGGIYGVEIPMRWVSWQEYAEEISPSPGANFHFRANMCPDTAKISSRLGYSPRYTPEHSMSRAVEWMREQGLLDQ
jgi:nucleoside-diphosphate-sugar epimerase